MTYTKKEKEQLLSMKRMGWGATRIDSVKFVWKLEKKIMKRYSVSKARAQELVWDASNYNINDESDVFYIIETELLTNQEKLRLKSKNWGYSKRQYRVKF